MENEQIGSEIWLTYKLASLGKSREIELKEADETGMDKVEIARKYEQQISEVITQFSTQRAQGQSQKREINIGITYTNELESLQEQLKKGELSFAQYTAKKDALLKESERNAIESQITEAETVLMIAKKQGANTEELEKNLTNLRKKLREEDLADETAFYEKRAELEQKLTDLKYQLATAVIDAISQLTTMMIDKELAKFDEKTKIETAADEKQKQAELDKAGNNQKVKDQIEAKYEAKQKQRDAARAKIEQKKLAFEGLAAIAKLSIDTIKTVAQLKMQAAALVAVNPGLAAAVALEIPLVIALNAVSAGMIAATQLKGFSEGGSTGSGSDDQVAGVVHKNEYVIPARLMQSTMVRNYVEEIETMRTGKKFMEGGFTSSGGYTVPEQMKTDPRVTTIINIVDQVKSNTSNLDVNTLNEISKTYQEAINIRKEEFSRKEMLDESEKYNTMVEMARDYYSSISQIESSNETRYEQRIDAMMSKDAESTKAHEQYITRVKEMMDAEISQTIDFQLQAKNIVNETYKSAQISDSVTSSQNIMSTKLTPSVNFSQAVNDIRSNNVSYQNSTSPELGEMRSTMEKLVQKMEALDTLNTTLSNGIKATAPFVWSEFEAAQKSVDEMRADSGV
jgi:hypothetical protein